MRKITEFLSSAFLINSYEATFSLESPLFTGVVETINLINSYGKLRTSYVIIGCFNDETHN